LTADHKASLRASTETLIKLQDRASRLQGEIVKGATGAEIEAARTELMSIAEAYVDLMIAAGVQVRKIIEP
jgi:hypothetical protein